MCGQGMAIATCLQWLTNMFHILKDVASIWLVSSLATLETLIAVLYVTTRETLSMIPLESWGHICWLQRHRWLCPVLSLLATSREGLDIDQKLFDNFYPHDEPTSAWGKPPILRALRRLMYRFRHLVAPVFLFCDVMVFCLYFDLVVRDFRTFRTAHGFSSKSSGYTRNLKTWKKRKTMEKVDKT